MFSQDFIEVWITRIIVTFVIIWIWEYGCHIPTMTTVFNNTSSNAEESEPALLQYNDLIDTSLEQAHINNNDDTKSEDDGVNEDNDDDNQAMDEKEILNDESNNNNDDGDDGDDEYDNKISKKPPSHKNDNAIGTEEEPIISSEQTTISAPSTNNDTNNNYDNNIRTTLASSSSSSSSRPRFKAQSSVHPGMDDFCYWYDIETSLFRIYTLGRADNITVAPPYVPHSHRGTVPIYLHVTNKTRGNVIVNWVDYKGKFIPKGIIKPNHTWTQTTYIDHPWVFEDMDQNALLYYIPYRVIPTLPTINTVSENGSGMHKFTLLPPTNNNYNAASSLYRVSIKDDVMPFPGCHHFTSISEAVTWSLHHMARMGYDNNMVELLLKYLDNIIESPENVKYRQIRTRSKHFSPIWMSPARGLLLALGFVEVNAYAELGCSKPLSPGRVQDVLLVVYLIKDWQQKQNEQTQPIPQPEGADGYGRQGYGRAGTMS